MHLDRACGAQGDRRLTAATRRMRSRRAQVRVWGAHGRPPGERAQPQRGVRAAGSAHRSSSTRLTSWRPNCHPSGANEYSSVVSTTSPEPECRVFSARLGSTWKLLCVPTDWTWLIRTTGATVAPAGRTSGAHSSANATSRDMDASLPPRTTPQPGDRRNERTCPLREGMSERLAGPRSHTPAARARVPRVLLSGRSRIGVGAITLDAKVIVLAAPGP